MFQKVYAWVSQNGEWPKCYYKPERFCGQDAEICDCPSCPVKCTADGAAYQAQKRLELANSIHEARGQGKREPTCYGYCGSLGWTVRNHGRVTHKQFCPHRTEPWCQSHPKGCPEDCVPLLWKDRK